MGNGGRRPVAVDRAPVGGVDEVGHLLPVDGLLLEQRRGDQLETLLVATQELGRPLLLLAEDALDLFVDDAAGVLRVVTRVHQVLTEEDHPLGPPRHGTHAIAHSPFADHLASQDQGTQPAIPPEALTRSAYLLTPPHSRWPPSSCSGAAGESAASRMPTTPATR